MYLFHTDPNPKKKDATQKISTKFAQYITLGPKESFLMMCALIHVSK